MALSIAYSLGFREYHLFGYDATIPTPAAYDQNKLDKDGKRMYYQTECLGKHYWTCGEFIVLATEFENIYKNFPKMFGVSFHHHGKNTLLHAIYQANYKPLLDYQTNLQNSLQFSEKIKQQVKGDFICFNKPVQTNNMVLKPYKSYNEYKDYQVAANKRKNNWIFVNHECIEMLADYLLDELGEGNIKFGICHGCRRGLEQKWFSEELKCHVIGTEISSTASNFPNTIEWDFHNIKGEWINQCDFIYSNSFDHSYDPEYCLDQWMKCLKPNGLCIIEWTQFHDINTANKTDPFGANLQGYKDLFTQKYQVKELLKSYRSHPIVDIDGKIISSKITRYFFIIQHKIAVDTQVLYDMNN